MDRISRLPPAIMETILCLLPIQEAARTSILSKEWRYHWIKIPKLAFIEDTYRVSWDKLSEGTFFLSSERKMIKRCKLFCAIHQVLIMHQGPIHEFTLSMEVDGSCVEIDHIILHLSKRNTVKILKLDLVGIYVLPLSFISLHQLTNLSVKKCSFERFRSFSGLCCLTTLCLQSSFICVKTLLCLFSSCPLLKRLTLDDDNTVISYNEEFTIVDLFKCLPVINYLYVPCQIVHLILFTWYMLDYINYYQSMLFALFKNFAPKRLPKELPTTLTHLKCLCIHDLCLSRKYELPFLALLIRSSPNLEKLKLEMCVQYKLEDRVFSSLALKDYSHITLEHLSEFDIVLISNKPNEWDFVKLILAKSPVLKKAGIAPLNALGKDEELRLSKILLSSPCASSEVKIKFS